MSTRSPELTLAIVAGACAVIGLGQLLASKEKITWRKAIGRAVCGAGIGTASAFLLLLIPFSQVLSPDQTVYAQLGLGCFLASFGTSGLERLVAAYGKK